ncbi:acyltransferase [Streptococcus mitis]|jgi:hypothetical protein|uniref:acyltransferase n=1 Tax=Streptococcus mitis TaxID=28037 RepID=UPI0021B51109|nr:acyltransferase [Streptococcus mitis]
MVTNKTRYIGIECCRIIAMLMICNLHVLGIGGVLDKVGNQKDIYYFLANILEAFSYPAVNIFILISGYVGLYSQFSYKKMSKFWLQIIFYTISITLTFAVFSKLSVTPTEWFYALTPISNGQYWYMSCYFGLMLIAPLLNQAILTMKKELLLPIITGGFIYFSIIPTIFKQDSLGIWRGYSVLWMILLYIVGAIIRKFKYESYFQSWKVILGILLLTSLTFVLYFFNYEQWRSYSSPTVTFQGILIFLLCLSIKNIPPSLEKIVLLLSPLTLGVYLFHVHPLIFRRIIPTIHTLVEEQEFSMFVIIILVMTLVLFFSGAIIEYFRNKLMAYILTLIKNFKNLKQT